ncbi:rRNA maturation RNase YbeY [Flavobacterium aciduliphilum]|uniref:Endoribonuclease YbeY n=1 Tax=Flavobacterium aciduliphilum TaxID=1101402 RepID=A0A328YIK3_9FLAO|nr:rRNA maturation RNase YbeY [Flavobacterium aciduliphilum]RAR72873.1 rRNA maturation RNase YbeY [Flavobacterium aciduliphilum]
MIEFCYETDFVLEDEVVFSSWITKVIQSENKKAGDITYVFCDDEYILEINKKYLNHDYYTDIISFDYSVGNELHGDIFVSIDRVHENASSFNVSFAEELKRVIIHGVLHYCGYKDKSPKEELQMRSKEDEKIKMFHAEL